VRKPRSPQDAERGEELEKDKIVLPNRVQDKARPKEIFSDLYMEVVVLFAYRSVHTAAGAEGGYS